MPRVAARPAALVFVFVAWGLCRSVVAQHNGVPALGPPLQHGFDVSTLSLLGLDDTSIVAAYCVDRGSDWQLQVSILARAGLAWNETQQEPVAVATLPTSVRSGLAQLGSQLLLGYGSEGQVVLHLLGPAAAAGTLALAANVTSTASTAVQLAFESQEILVLCMLQDSLVLSACIVAVQEIGLQLLACSEGPEATSFQLISMTGRSGFFVFHVSPNGDLRVSSVLVSPFQVSWLPSWTVLSADEAAPARRLLWVEKLLVDIGDYGILFQESLDGPERLAIGRFSTDQSELAVEFFALEDRPTRFAQVPSGALLLGTGGLRFGLREVTTNAISLGPVYPVDAIYAQSVKAAGLHTEAVLVTAESLQLVADYRCQLPLGLQRYDPSNCSGNLEASRCKLACRQENTVPEPGFASPRAMCPEEGGTFVLNGCSPPRCFLSEAPLQFNVSQCSTSPERPLSEQECGVQCRSGQTGATATCLQNLGTFQLSGCEEVLCRLPAETTGYDVSQCKAVNEAVPLYECQVSCAPGFQAADGAQVFCDEGSSDFRLTGCYEYCEAPAEIENAFAPSCASGATVQHGSLCVAQCVEGYAARPKELRCERGILVPQSFECNQANCIAPEVANAKEPSCQEGVLLISGSKCTPQCLEGYEANLESLHCDKGQLSPANFSCDGRPCSAPVDEAYATPSCAEGLEIPHGGTCTGQCLPGSTALPRVLQCQVQELQPANFTCGQLCDAPVEIPHALQPSCREGAVLEHGTFCSPRCAEGFEPLVALDAELQANAPPGAASLRCLDGEMRPPRFTCAAVKCRAPLGVPGAADPACAEGFNIGSGDFCTASCEPGYAASPAKLQCNATALAPESFACLPQSCIAPESIWNAQTPACAEGQVISHLGSCTPRCALGFAATEASLSCRFGSFLPQSFGCSQAAVFGTQVWSVAATAGASASGLAAFRQETKLVLHLLEEREGMVVSTGSEAVDENSQPTPPFLMSFDGQALLVFFRQRSCTQELVLQGVSTGANVQVLTSTAMPGIGLGPLAGTLMGSNAIVVAGRQVFLVQPTLRAEPLTTASLTPDLTSEVSEVSVAAARTEEAVVAYIVAGCLKLRLVSGSQLTLHAEEELFSTPSENCGAISVALGTSDGSFFLASSSMQRRGHVQLWKGQVSDASMLWQSPWQLFDEAASHLISSPWGDEGALLYGAQLLDGRVVLRLVSDGPSSPSYEVPGTSSGAPMAFAALEPFKVALAFSSTSGGALWTVPRRQCRLPSNPLLIAYNVTGCAGGLLYEDQCHVRCSELSQGSARTTCPSENGTFQLSGCVSSCVAPADSVVSPACREGERIPIGGVCTAACPDGFAATAPVLVCNYVEQISQLPWFFPRSFSCLPLSCVAPPCGSNMSKPSCQGGWNVPHGKLCLPNCLPGYAPSVPYLRCSAGTLVPSSYSCSLQGISCAAPVVFGASRPSCVEGDIIAHGGVCTARCDEGTATVTSPLQCEAGQFSPATFECAQPCFLSQVPANALLPPCAEGLSIPHGGTCTFQCDFGFRAEPSVGTCNRGNLGNGGTGAAFSCVQVAQDCLAPSSAFLLGVGYVAAPQKLCAGETAAVGHLQECQTQCPRAGYSPTPTVLSCSDGALTPESFTCGRSCSAGPLQEIPWANPSGACEEGAEIGHSQRCTAFCAAGYVPSVPSLECYDGGLSPPSFECRLFVRGCSAPSVDFATEPACSEGNFIVEGQSCSSKCQEGYVASSKTLTCQSEVLSPSTFQCFPGCMMTGVAPRGGNCGEGDLLHGEFCEATCGPGYGPSVEGLLCQRGVLSPTSFECERTCSAVVGSAAIYLAISPDWPMPSGAACEEGEAVASRKSCSAKCGEGYLPSLSRLECLDGVFTPESFQCDVVRPCFLSSVPFAESPPCLEGFSLPHNSSCTAQCLQGYVPSFASLECWDGTLTPLSFGCLKICEVPVVQNSPLPCGETGEVLPGSACHASCVVGFSPSVDVLRCDPLGSGRLSPETFTCGLDCETPDIYGALAAPCAELPLRHGRSCDIQCPSRSNSEGQVWCNDGVLQYNGAVSCRQNGPNPENVPSALAPVCGSPGSTRHGLFCQAQCRLGYTAVPATLQCQDGRLVDPDYFQNFQSTTATSTTRTFSTRTSSSATSTSASSTSTSQVTTLTTTSSTRSDDDDIVMSNVSQTVTSTTEFGTTSFLENSTEADLNGSSNQTEAEEMVPTGPSSTTSYTRTSSIPATSSTVTSTSNTIVTVTLTDFEGAPSFACVPVPQFRLESAGLFYTAGVPTGARSLHVHFAGNEGLAVAFTSSGALLVTVGYERIPGMWSWGEAATVHGASNQDFLVSLAACRRESFIVAFRTVELKPSLQSLLLGPIGFAPAVGCARSLTTASISELQLVSPSDLTGVWLLYANNEGAWVHFVTNVYADLQVSDATLIGRDVRRVTGVSVLDAPSAILALAYESGTSQPMAYGRLVKLEDGAAVMGETTVLNAGPLLYPSMVALSDGRLAISFGDGSSQPIALRLAKMGGWSSAGLDVLDFGESFVVSLGVGPSNLQRFSPEGPLLLSSGEMARWIYLWGRHLASGSAITLAAASGVYPDTQQLRVDEVTLLLSSTGDPGAVSKLMLKWPCLLPQDATGYRLTSCNAALTPLLEEDCIVACDVGFVVEGLRPMARCAGGVFQLSGCKALPCSAPMGIHNAMSPSCVEGAAVEDGEICHSACAAGYQPSISELRCQVGRFNPPDFKCFAECCDADGNDGNDTGCVAMEPVNLPCAAPLGVGLAEDPSCREGHQIARGGSCRSRCQAGYAPDVATLLCDVNGSGQFTPPRFHCERQRSNLSEKNSTTWSSEVYLINATVRLELFPESLDTPPEVLVELPAVRGVLREELLRGGLNEGLRQAVAAACRSKVDQVAVLALNASNAEEQGRRLMEEVFDLLVLGVFLGEENVTEAVLQLEELTAGGNAQGLFEGQIRNSWAILLQDFPATSTALQGSALGWISKLRPGPQPIRMEVVSSAADVTLPSELQRFLDTALEGSTAETDAGDQDAGFPYSDGFLDFVPLKALQDFRIHLATRLPSGLAIDVSITFLALLALGAVNLILAFLHYRCWVRRLPALQQGGWDETAYRSVYVIPESHRYAWNPKCRTSSVATLCCLCFCPCLRIPMTWHRGGVLPYWQGFFSCCIFGPICWSCLGFQLRSRMSMVFGIPGSIFRRFLLWLCCCCCASVQESLHVDSALRAITEASKESLATKAEVRSQLQRAPTPEQMDSIVVDEEPPMTTGRLQTLARRASEQMQVINTLRPSEGLSGSSNIAPMPAQDADADISSSSSDSSASSSAKTSDDESSVSSKSGGSKAIQLNANEESRL